MSAETLNELMVQANRLTPDEQLHLAAYLVERVRSGRVPRRQWREIRGMARPSLLGEDAQTWVSRGRREADEPRERQWSNS
ncbi:MAG: hypothetical protein AB1801_29225 [Chloroflexota bacterium]